MTYPTASHRFAIVPLLAALLVVYAGPKALAQETDQQQRGPFSEATVQRLRGAIENKMQERGIPGLSAVVVADGRTVFSEGFGFADVENQVPATPSTVYRTASIAKPITAIALMQQAKQGRIDLDRPIDEYFKAFPKKQWPITARQLLSHQGGVRHYRGRQEPLTTRHYRNVREGLAIFAGDPLLFEPETRFHYSSFGFNLLGALLEESAGEPFHAYLQRAVFHPAGMDRTRTDDHFAIVPHRARGYMRPTSTSQRRGYRQLETGELYNAPLHDTSSKIPGGGLLSTAEDLTALATSLLKGDLLSSESLEEMWQARTTRDGNATQYGLGFRVFEVEGQKIVGHGGGQAGVTTSWLINPQNHSSVAIMCNLQDAGLEGLAVELLRATESLAIPTSLEEVVQQDNQPEDDKVNYDGVAEKLREFIERERKQKDLPAVSISLVHGDQIVWAAGFGPQDKQGKTPATPDTLYRAGSVSKLFTDLAVMRLVEKGQLDLDADVRTYLPEFQPENPFGEPITLRQLMSHRSGLVREPPVGHYFDPNEPSIAETVASLNSTRLVYQPGTRTKYSNAAIAVVGHVVEKVSGQSFEEHMQEHFLRPMQMNASSFYLQPELKDRLATAWMWSHHAPRFEPPLWPLGTLPAGNLYASTNDLAHFLITIFNNGQYGDTTIVKPEVIEQMLRPTRSDDGEVTNYGIGFRLGELDGHRTFGHGGAIYGYATNFVGMPDKKIGVATVTGLDVANGFLGRLSEYALRLMLAAQNGERLPEVEQSKPLPPGLAKQIEGIYQADGKEIDCYAFDDRLYMRETYTVREIRALGDKLVVDDVHGFGPTLEVAGNDLVLRKTRYARMADTLPPACPQRWEGLIGEYGWDHNVLYIYEDRGQLRALIEWFYDYPLTELEDGRFAFPENEGLYFGEHLVFERDGEGNATQAIAAGISFKRRPLGMIADGVFQITPVRPIEELRRDAMAATPPREPQQFRDPDLVELTDLDDTILLDIRYAGERNFMGTPFYTSAHAFMQRPAAEGVARANRKLAELGYGLLVYDAYRPWFVTKMFWDGTPPDLHDFVANPDHGSRHNRGCAVDLTLYDLKTKQPVDTVAGYDEFSPRSYPLYPGGTSQQRWHRRLLRNVMEEEGFTVYEFEWWHFDFKSWRHYPIGNTRFEDM